MASLDSIGLSALQVSQRLLDLTGQNITNAGTPGYHRQVASLAAVNPGGGLEIGLGVEITQIRRVLDQTLERSLTRNLSATSDVSTRLASLRQVEEHLRPGEGSLLSLFEDVRNQAVILAGKPDDAAAQRVLLNRAADLADRINSLHTELRSVRTDVDTRIAGAVTRVNDLADQIAALNLEIERIRVQGVSANDSQDRRDQLINELAGLIDVRPVEVENGVVNVFAGGMPLVLGNKGLHVKTQNVGDAVRLVPVDLPSPLQTSGGEMHGLLELRNTILPDVLGRVEAWSAAIVKTFDQVQATGLGAAGPFQSLFGNRPVDNVNLPLSKAGLAFPPQAGTLFVSVTNQATGQRTLHSLAIDPATQSLQDVANAFSSIPNLQGVVDTQSRTLTLVAQPGYAFDFAGRLPTAPENVAVTRTAVPSVGGAYTGTVNDTFTFTAIGSGTVGVTPNLKLEARNGAGQLLASWNIGQGYAPGTALPGLEGVEVRLEAGTINNGDSFGGRVVGDPDAGGLLGALGLNTFFEGGFVGTLRVRDELVQRPQLLSGSRTGQPSDGSNWRRLADGLDAPILAGGTSTMSKFFADLMADVGSRVQDLDGRQTALQALGQGLEAERQAVSGVDPNEELVRLLQYQRAFQVSARFINVVNETMQELLRLV